ncbi:MAG: DUF6159 family protein [Hyphomicrobiales bacterium]
MEKIRNALKLVKACWKVLMLDKELLLFPVMSMAVQASLLMSVLFQFGFFYDFEWAIENLIGTLETTQEWVLVLYAFLSYFVAYFVIIFFNAAMIACVKIRFAGGDPTVIDGLRFSITRLPQILVWATVAATVGFILEQFEKKSEGIFSFFLRFLGAAWGVATYFVVPVLVSENIGPISAIERSVSIIRRTWGEALASVIGLSVLAGGSFLIAFLIFFLAIFLSDYSLKVTAAMGIGAIAFGLVSGLVFTTLGAILKAALYTYAVDGKIPDQFDNDLIENAFSKKEK